MDIREQLRALRAGWLLLLLGLVLGGAVAAGISSLLPVQYTATTQLFVSTTGADDLDSALQGTYFAEGRVASYAELLRSKELATDVIEDLDLEMPTGELIGRLEVGVVTDTTVINVAATDGTPEGALAIADSVGQQFQALVRELETPEGEETSPVRITITATPDLPTSPSSPLWKRNTALGAGLGLLLAGIVLVVRRRLDTTVTDDEVAARLAGAPVIGHVPASPEFAAGRAPRSHRTTPAAEAIRLIRTNLAFLDVDHPPRTILLTSSLPGEGKSTLAVNLALALAESGNTVTLVEADLRRPRVIKYLGLVGGVGLTNVLTGTAPLDEVIQPVGEGRLAVVGAGPLPPNPSELMGSEAMADVLRQLSSTRDVVLIDTPPLLPVADASALAGIVDGVLLCARWGSVDADELERSAALVRRLGGKLLGVVVTQTPAKALASSYQYGYGTDDPAEQKRRGWFRRRPAEQAPKSVAVLRPRNAIRPPLVEDDGDEPVEASRR